MPAKERATHRDITKMTGSLPGGSRHGEGRQGQEPFTAARHPDRRQVGQPTWPLGPAWRTGPSGPPTPPVDRSVRSGPGAAPTWCCAAPGGNRDLLLRHDDRPADPPGRLVVSCLAGAGGAHAGCWPTRIRVPRTGHPSRLWTLRPSPACPVTCWPGARWWNRFPSTPPPATRWAPCSSRFHSCKGGTCTTSSSPSRAARSSCRSAAVCFGRPRRFPSCPLAECGHHRLRGTGRVVQGRHACQGDHLGSERLETVRRRPVTDRLRRSCHGDQAGAGRRVPGGLRPRGKYRDGGCRVGRCRYGPGPLARRP